MQDEIMIRQAEEPADDNREGFSRIMHQDEWNLLQGSFTPAEIADAEEAYKLDRV